MVFLEFDMKLNAIVAQIICAPNFDHFSTLEVRSAYLALNQDKSVDPNYARRFVYTELLKLHKKGWLRKLISKKKEITTFVKTNDFNSYLILNKSIVTKEVTETSVDSSINDSITEKLFERLGHYKNELLLGLGEADEYKQLCNQFPELQAALQPRYNQVREQNSKLLGSIKAIENLTSAM